MIARPCRKFDKDVSSICPVRGGIWGAQMRRRVYEILELGQGGDRVSRAVDLGLIALITASVAALVVSTDARIYAAAPGFFTYFELAAFSIFAVEYLLRIWACTADPRFAHPVTGRLRFALRPIMIADAAAVLTYFIVLIAPLTGLDLGAFRALRLVSRTARMARYSPGLQALASVMAARKNELLAMVSVIGALLVMASSLMYFVEGPAQPDKFSSIPAAMWWSVITITTVGYGDVAPVTPLGRLLSGVIALLAVGIIALPAGIMGSGFWEQVNRGESAAGRTCPHCGGEIGAERRPG